MNQSTSIISRFKSITGNAKAMIIFQPVYAIPSSLYAPFMTLYMLELGLTNAQIGFITSIGLFLQIFISLIASHITDRFGRRLTTFIADVLSWGIPITIWIFAQNFWYFFAASIFGSTIRIIMTSWNCLFVEDTPDDDRLHAFNIMQLVNVLSSFATLLSGFLIEKYSLVITMRYLLSFTLICMIVKFIGTYVYTKETKIGLQKLENRKPFRLSSIIDTIRFALNYIFSNRFLLMIFLLTILNGFQATLKGTYFSIYLVKTLAMKDSFISISSVLTSVVIAIVSIFLLPRLNPHKHTEGFLIAGLGVTLLGSIIIALMPEKNLWGILLSITITAAGTALYQPFLDSTLANAIENENRSAVVSILNTISLMITAPAGIIGGLLFSISGRVLMALVSIILFASLMFITMVVIVQRKSHQLGV